MGKKRERMDVGFSVFNCHVNDASDRADEEFIAVWGQEKFDKHIAPLHEEGIMLVLQKPESRYKTYWVALCTTFANEGKNGRRETLQEVMRIARKNQRRYKAKPHEFGQAAAAGMEEFVQDVKAMPKHVPLPRKKVVTS